MIYLTKEENDILVEIDRSTYLDLNTIYFNVDKQLVEVNHVTVSDEEKVILLKMLSRLGSLDFAEDEVRIGMVTLGVGMDDIRQSAKLIYAGRIVAEFNNESGIMTHPLLQELPQYHFERGEFVRVITENYPDFEDDFYTHVDMHTESFSIFRVSDERYILHRESGTMISWYKNLGRTNACNKPLDLEGLREFILLFKVDMDKEELR